MITKTTLNRVRDILTSGKSFCPCQLAERISDTVGEGGDRTDWIEIVGKRVRIASGKQEEVFLCDGLRLQPCCSSQVAVA